MNVQVQSVERPCPHTHTQPRTAGDADQARGPDPLLPRHLQRPAAVRRHGGALRAQPDQRAQVREGGEGPPREQRVCGCRQSLRERRGRETKDGWTHVWRSVTVCCHVASAATSARAHTRHRVTTRPPPARHLACCTHTHSRVDVGSRRRWIRRALGASVFSGMADAPGGQQPPPTTDACPAGSSVNPHAIQVSEPPQQQQQAACTGTHTRAREEHRRPPGAAPVPIPFVPHRCRLAPRTASVRITNSRQLRSPACSKTQRCRSLACW